MTTPHARILVVEDDRTTAELLRLYLEHAGHEVHVEHDGAVALTRLDGEVFDLLLLDIMLPGVDGLALCRAARARADTPVILLSARTREEDRVAGLELGADDYVPKPFSPRELVARVHAVLRRALPHGRTVFQRGPVRIDCDRALVTVSGAEVSLTASEYALLVALARHPGYICTRQQLLEALPGEPSDRFDRTVDVHVRNLRRKLEVNPAHPQLIETVVGQGYRFARAAGSVVPAGTPGSVRG